jgi:hypothetical protein
MATGGFVVIASIMQMVIPSLLSKMINDGVSGKNERIVIVIGIAMIVLSVVACWRGCAHPRLIPFARFSILFHAAPISQSALIEKLNGAACGPPFAVQSNEAAVSAAGGHFEKQVRIPTRLIDGIAFACQKRVVSRSHHEQRNIQSRKVVAGRCEAVEVLSAIEAKIRCGEMVVELLESRKFLESI